jgi:hypothetical protein
MFGDPMVLQAIGLATVSDYPEDKAWDDVLSAGTC